MKRKDNKQVVDAINLVKKMRYGSRLNHNNPLCSIKLRYEYEM